ncbi:MAG: hypothetical protein MJ244_05765 [Clostridia bacterium]|nr:hypothetical protein [Clostridia bacterium]
MLQLTLLGYIITFVLWLLGLKFPQCTNFSFITLVISLILTIVYVIVYAVKRGSSIGDKIFEIAEQLFFFVSGAFTTFWILNLFKFKPVAKIASFNGWKLASFAVGAAAIAFILKIVQNRVIEE